MNLRNFQNFNKSIGALSFSNEGSLLMAGCDDKVYLLKKSIKIFDYATGEIIRSYVDFSKDFIRCITPFVDSVGKYLVGSYDGSISILDINSSSKVQIFNNRKLNRVFITVRLLSPLINFLLV